MHLIVLQLILSFSLSLPAFAQPREERQNAEAQQAWREDLQYLVERMESLHPDLFWRVSEEDFRAMVSELEADIPYLSDDQIALGLLGLVTIADAHSHLTLYQPAVGFQVYPLQVYFFNDGLFVVDAADESIIGAEVTAINDQAIEPIYEQIAPLVTHDNIYGILNLAPSLIVSPQVLQGLGIIDDVNQPNFALTLPSGETQLFNAEPTSPPESWWAEWYMTNLPQRPEPMYITRHLDNDFWFTFLEDSGTLYIQYNWIDGLNPDGESINAFVRRIETFIDEQPFERVVLDLRHNSGGNNTTYAPLLRLLTQDERINQPETLFVLIGRRTFSAAVNLLIDIEQQTEAIFVGEATGDTPNMYADPSFFKLPNSGIEAAISRRFWNKSPDDPRRWIEPDISVVLSSADFFSDHDPVLVAAISQPE